MRMQKWIDKPYVVESSDFEDGDERDGKEDTDEVANKDNGDDNYKQGTLSIEGADKEEDFDKHEERSVTDNGEHFAQGMNSPPRMNKHIRFSPTSSSTPSADVIVQHGSTSHFVETVEPMIKYELTSPSP
ncbi:unnamed protein product [Lactuca saligna]|uniref:Uncharacterized protein n=1 Tax=Lactuca saligna TaxID=75948 RepID=A0AA35V2E6_LACSI|nr:unnamed protein product [Lactuca saligna]